VRVVVLDTRVDVTDIEIARTLSHHGHAVSHEAIAFATPAFAEWRATVPNSVDTIPIHVRARTLPSTIRNPLELREIVLWNAAEMIEQALVESRADLGIVIGELGPLVAPAHPRLAHVAPRTRRKDVREIGLADVPALPDWAATGAAAVAAWLAHDRTARPPQSAALELRLHEVPQD
jgi:predicted CoA-binding protein